MSDEDRIAELLLRWEELREQGQELSAADLCRDCPQLAAALARRIQGLKATAWMEDRDTDDGIQLEPPIPQPPRTLAGRYRLDEKVAEGGFAEVWKGHDLELGRAVAVKVPRRDRLHSAEGFVAEARRVARLKHPGVVPVFDVGRDGDTVFIVSEFVEGGSLAHRIARERISPQEAVRLVAEVAETLAYAHRQGFVHRDIKPGNVLLDHHGRALLTDFGIARSHEERSSGDSFGTLAYMAPEQIEGRAADHRSDIYSLGVVLYELLTGELPHRADDPVELRRRIVSKEPSFEHGANAAVPAAVKRICLKCLKREPGQRYEDAAELAQELRRANLNHRPLRATRWLIALASAAILALVGFVVLPALPWRAVEDKGATSAEKHDGQQDAQKAVEKTPLEAALALGRLHAERKRWATAEEAFTEAIRLDPAHAEAYRRRGGCRFNAGRAEEALSDFDTAAGLDPKNPEVFMNRGVVYLNLTRFDEALADLKHALELAPDDSAPVRKVLGETYGHRAYLHSQKKEWKQADADFTEAIRHDPANAGYFDRRGSMRFNLKEYEDARKDFTEAIRLDPKQPGYYLHRGFALEALGQKEEAAEDYRRGKAKDK